MRDGDERVRIAGAFVVVCLVWGTTPFSIKVGLNAGWQPLWFCALRLLLAAGTVGVYVLTGRAGRPLGLRGWRIVAPMGIFGIAVNFGLTAWGQAYIGGALASLIVGVQPITTTLIAHSIQRQRINARFGLGLLAGICGLLAIFRGAGIPDRRALLGALAVLAGVTIYGAIFVYIKARLGDLNLARVVGTQNLIGGVLVAPAALLFEGWIKLPTQRAAWVSLGYLVLVSSITALVLAIWLIGKLGAPKFSILSFVTPVIGMLASVLWLGEALAAMTLLGAGLVGIALALTLRNDSGSTRQAPPVPMPELGDVTCARSPDRALSPLRSRADEAGNAEAAG